MKYWQVRQVMRTKSSGRIELISMETQAFLRHRSLGAEDALRAQDSTCLMIPAEKGSHRGANSLSQSQLTRETKSQLFCMAPED